MPIIGQAKIQKEGGQRRGILVDRDGFFVDRVQWSGSRPAVNEKGTPKEKRKRLLPLETYPNAANVPSRNAKWDFEAMDWIAPNDEMVLIKEDTGEVVKRFKGFKDKLPDCPEGCVIVDDVPPKVRHFKPIYDKAKQAFVRPRRVALIDPDGVVKNVVLENPNDSAPDVDVPKGWSRVDDRDEWPVDDDRAPIGIGAKRAGGKWLKPEKPKKAAQRVDQNKGRL